MKNLILSALLGMTLHAHAQVAVGATTANASAALDVVSTTKGVLMPRLTQAQRTAMNPLPAAAPGLLVYQTDGTAGYYYNSSTTTTPSWVFLAPVSMPVAVAEGGTGATTAAGARTALGAAASGANTDITSLAPASAGTINNMAIGGTAPAAATFTTLGATGVFTANAGTVNAYTLPVTRGTNGEVLTTNGSGAANWAAPASQVPAGTIVAFAGTTAPAGWAFCNGAAVSRTTNAALFTAISTTYGSGDGSSTFNLPDLRGRTVFGKDDMGGSNAGRLGTGWGIAGTTLGASGGVPARSLSTNELPSHTHGINDPGHRHNYIAPAVSNLRGNINGNNSGAQWEFSDVAYTGVSVNYTGGGQSFSILNPGIVLNYIIKL